MKGPFRGLAYGCLFSIPLWVLIYLAVKLALYLAGVE